MTGASSEDRFRPVMGNVRGSDRKDPVSPVGRWWANLPLDVVPFFDRHWELGAHWGELSASTWNRGSWTLHLEPEAGRAGPRLVDPTLYDITEAEKEELLRVWPGMAPLNRSRTNPVYGGWLDGRAVK